MKPIALLMCTSESVSLQDETDIIRSFIYLCTKNYELQGLNGNEIP